MADGALTLTDHAPMAKVLVHAPATGSMAERLGVPFGHARRADDGTLVLRVQPAQWLLLGEPGRGPELAERWQAGAGDEFVSVVDVSSGRALLRLTGDDAPALLAKVCALDLEGAPDGSARRSSVAKVTAEIVRDDGPAGRRSFLIACDRSYGRYLFDALADAGAEFQIEISEGGS